MIFSKPFDFVPIRMIVRGVLTFTRGGRRGGLAHSLFPSPPFSPEPGQVYSSSRNLVETKIYVLYV